MNKGWVCPKCDKVLAPHVDECKKCNEEVGGYYPFAPAYPWDQTAPWARIASATFTKPPMLAPFT